MLPFALSRFIAAHFSAPKDEPEASVRWRKLHGHSMSVGVQSYVALGGIAGHGFAAQIDDSNRARAQSKTPFEDALVQAQAEGSPLPLVEPFAGGLKLGRTKTGEGFYALVSVRSELAPVVGWDVEENALTAVCADDVTSFAALNHISAQVLGRGHTPNGRTLKGLIEALDDRVAFPEPYTLLEHKYSLADLFPAEYAPDPGPHRFYQRSAYLMDALITGEFSMGAWADFEQPVPNPTKALRNIHRSCSTALYWMWRLYFEGHDVALAAVLDAAKESKAAWIVDSARVVAELVAGRRTLGSIEDIAALREHISRVVRDPSMLAARKATQRRETVDKRIGNMRVPSGLRFDPTDVVPEGTAPESSTLVVTPDGGVELHENGETRPLLPPEMDATVLDALRLDDDLFVVLSELPGEKATKRRLTIYRIGHRVVRMGGHVSQDPMGKSGVVRVSGTVVGLWKEAVEEERMFPWTGRTTVYAVVDGNLVTLGGASYDCVGARVVDGALYGLRADGSGYQALCIEAAVENQSIHHAGPRFSPIPITEPRDDDGWRDVFAPGPVAVVDGQLQWKVGPLPRRTPCPPHLRSELGVCLSRDGKTAWLMSRTGCRIDSLELQTGSLRKLCEWPDHEGWAVGVAEAGEDLVVVSTWRARVLKRDTLREIWAKPLEEAQSVAGLPSRHFAILARGNSGPGLLTVRYVRDLEEAPDNPSDAAGDWSSYGYAGEEIFLVSTGESIGVAGEKTRGLLDPAILENIPHWARSRGWFDDDKTDEASP